MNSAEKDVQEQLAKHRRRRRAPGEVVYPLEYSRDAADFDNWEHAYMKSLHGGLTIHRFEQPPKTVLDVGCGAGLWVMEAALEWPDATFVGLDMKDIQPDLDCLDVGADQRSLARRIKWVHANFLDKLPHSSDHFDFVRVSHIGLGVPEDEWSDILQEIYRVLKPSGILEIIEEDLIFPSGVLPHPDALSPGDGRVSAPSLRSYSSNLEARVPTSRRSTASGASGPGVVHASPASLAPSNSGGSGTTSISTHARLRSAWESLIARRFLCAQAPTVLPLHLSYTFAAVRAGPPVRVRLPRNSFAHALAGDEDAESEPDARGVAPADADEDADDEARMHLARAVRTVEGCRAALWTEYAALYGGTGGEDVGIGNTGDAHLLRAFEHDWEDWLCDMRDRTALRTHLSAHTAWSEPADDPDHGPAWRAWREERVLDALAGAGGGGGGSAVPSLAGGSSSLSRGSQVSLRSTPSALQERKTSFVSELGALTGAVGAAAAAAAAGARAGASVPPLPQPSALSASSSSPGQEICRSWRGFVAFKAKPASTV